MSSQPAANRPPPPPSPQRTSDEQPGETNSGSSSPSNDDNDNDENDNDNDNDTATGDLPMSMHASVILTNLPKDASAALALVDDLDDFKGTPASSPNRPHNTTPHILQSPPLFAHILTKSSIGAVSTDRVGADSEAEGLQDQCVVAV